MPNKTKQNTKNSTEQICSQPLYKSQTTHHTHPHQQQAGWLRGQPPQHVADAHTVLNVNPTVCPLAKKLLCPTQTRTHTHHPPPGSEHMRAQENNHTPTTGAMIVSHNNGLPRKEVIQPHLPVRLPCYDFVPITGPAFDRSPWGHGLRASPTFMT